MQNPRKNGIPLRLGLSWLTVALFLLANPLAWAGAQRPLVTLCLLAWLLAVTIWSALGVVREAERLAHILGEPLGTLILTLSIVVIEVTLIAAAMLDVTNVPTLGRDTMFAVLMIVLNGMVGLGLLVGGLKHYQQGYNLQGAGAYLAVIIPLSMIALVLPNFTSSAAHGRFSVVQASFFSTFTVMLYGLFIWLQTGRHKGFFKPSDIPVPADNATAPDLSAWGSIGGRTIRLLAHILPIMLLSKSVGRLLNIGIADLGAPTALGGIIIAVIVFTPEGISAFKAVSANQLTRAINLCLGAATSTVGLTVPAILVLGLLTGQPVILGLSAANMVLLAVTLILSTLTFSTPRTTMLEGAVHLSLFFVFLVLIFSP